MKRAATATAGPKVSIVVSVLDGAATLGECLAGVFEQDCPSWEIVVVDGGSRDGTVEILREHAARIAHWESRPDRGIYHAWNKALDHVRGEWICFLGADDRFRDRSSLSRMIAALDALPPDCRVAYAAVEVVERSGDVRAVVGAPWDEARGAFADHMSIPHQATFHRRALFEDVGRFDESFRICGDYELLLRELGRRPPRFVEGLVVVRMGAGGISDRPDQAVRMAHEFARARRMHGLSRVPPGLAASVLRARCRRLLARWLGPRVADAVAGAYRAVAGRPPG